VLLDSDSHHINASRHIFSVEKTFDGNLLKGIFATAAASSSLYHRDAVATEARWDQGPILHVFKAYFLRPKYSVRRAIFQHAREMRLGEQPCAALHVRRGDVIFQVQFNCCILSPKGGAYQSIFMLNIGFRIRDPALGATSTFISTCKLLASYSIFCRYE
jgi:hypothetical protein